MTHLSTTIRTPAAKATTHGAANPRRRGLGEHPGMGKHLERMNRERNVSRNQDQKNWTLTLTFWALMVFVAILTAVSVGASLSNPL